MVEKEDFYFRHRAGKKITYDLPEFPQFYVHMETSKRME